MLPDAADCAVLPDSQSKFAEKVADPAIPWLTFSA
jgi:hypothetical protein